MLEYNRRERQNYIFISFLEKENFIFKVRDLVRLFNVSKVSIYKDICMLNDRFTLYGSNLCLRSNKGIYRLCRYNNLTDDYELMNIKLIKSDLLTF